MCFGMSTNSVDCVQIRYKKQMISSLKTFYMSERFSIFSLYVANILSQNIMLLPTRGTLVMLGYTMPIWNFSVSCFWIILPWYPVRTLGTDFLIRPVLEVYRLNCCTPFVDLAAGAKYMEYFSAQIRSTTLAVTRSRGTHILMYWFSQGRNIEHPEKPHSSPWWRPSSKTLADTGLPCLTTLELAEASPVTFSPRTSYLHICRWIFPRSHSCEIRASHVDGHPFAAVRAESLVSMLLAKHLPNLPCCLPPHSLLWQQLMTVFL